MGCGNSSPIPILNNIPGSTANNTPNFINLKNNCIICNDEETIFNDSKLNNLYPPCKHSDEFGVQCIRHYISDKIKDSAISQLKCPLPGCNHRFNESLIKELTTKDEFRKYQKDVQSLSFVNTWTFQNCGIFVRNIFNDIDMVYRFHSLGYKRCPYCRFMIEKNGGCDHMTCRKCGNRFNWSTANTPAINHIVNVQANHNNYESIVGFLVFIFYLFGMHSLHG